MKNIVVVSTYPEHGSKNIGDQLITTCVTEIIRDLCDAQINTIWRADDWNNVKDIVLKANHIFIACLAIRPFMHREEYPYMQKIIESGISFSVIASGTSLPVHNNNLFTGFSTETINLLLQINEKATVFTTRGWLTQEFCHRFGLSNAIFCGDIAFYDKRFQDLSFRSGKKINKIVISDPHNSSKYLESLYVLYTGVASIFPNANIYIVLHGVNKNVEAFAAKNSINCIRLYEQKCDGLEFYNDADLHVGFRVHGHVSALKRGIYSYLLEQDGRGCDYGITIDKKITVPNYTVTSAFNLQNTLKWLVTRRLPSKGHVSPAEEIISLIRKDYAEDFIKFLGIEHQIKKFNLNNKITITKALNDL